MIALAVVLLLLGILQHELRLVSPRLFVVVVVIVLLLAIRRQLGRVPPRIIVVGGFLFLASIAVVAGPYVLIPDMRSVDNVVRAVGFALVPWIVFLLVYGAHQDVVPEPESESESLARWQLPVLIAGAFVLLAIAHWTLQRDFVLLFDEPVYLLQSRLMREPGFSRPIDSSLSRFFALAYVVSGDGRLYTQYTPGQPALLAAFDMVGLRWWSGVVMSTAAIAFTYLLGKDLISRRGGLIAAAMLATNQLFLVYGPSYVSHGFGLSLTTAAAWMTLRGMRSAGRSRLAFLAGAGLLLGCLVAVRPLTGGTITISIVAWQLLLEKRSLRDVVRLMACFAVGSALPFAAILAYNNVTNGSPLTFGYSVVHGKAHDMGFGQRGWVGPDEAGRMVARTAQFGPRQAVRNLVEVGGELARYVYPAILLVVPLALLAAHLRKRVRYGIVAVFLVLPAVHFFYFAQLPRFYLELFPFLFLAIAWLLALIRTRKRSLAVAIIAAILLGQLTIAASDIPRRASRRNPPSESVVNAVRREQASLGKVLVFVKGERLLHFVSWLNIGDFPGPIIVARDLDSENPRLMERFPEYAAIRVDQNGQLTHIARTP